MVTSCSKSEAGGSRQGPISYDIGPALARNGQEKSPVERASASSKGSVCCRFGVSDVQRLTRQPVRETDGEFQIVQIVVRDNNVDQALKALKKKMQREGLFREMKRRNHFEKPSERKAREKAEAVRRARKLARKRAQREGLLPKT
jgi:small subunit ribosomal protein S21